MVSETNRTQSRELLLESGIVLHAGKQLLAVHGLFQRQLLPPSAGTFHCIFIVFPPYENKFVLSLFQYCPTSARADRGLDSFLSALYFFSTISSICSYDT